MLIHSLKSIQNGSQEYLASVKTEITAKASQAGKQALNCLWNLKGGVVGGAVGGLIQAVSPGIGALVAVLTGGVFNVGSEILGNVINKDGVDNFLAKPPPMAEGI